MISRRTFARYTGLSLLGASQSGWLPQLAEAARSAGSRHKRCILLWMPGGPSQLETFDPKPDHENGGPTQAIATSVPGIHISENLPRLAQQMQHLAVIRSMNTKEGDHSRATYYLHTGYLPQGPVRYPTVGSLLAHQLHHDECELPACISIGPQRGLNPAAYESGFLGPAWSPLVVAGEQNPNDNSVSFRVRNLQRRDNVTADRAAARMTLLAGLEQDFSRQRPGPVTESHVKAYQQAERMMNSSAASAFRLDQEDDVVRQAYGMNTFGQGCLLARRLLEQNVPFVEVALTGQEVNGIGWDTHQDNFDNVSQLCEVLDPAWSTLLQDLQQRGLLQDTLVVWMGEFGRTPKINDNTGRDHWPGGWSAVLAGAGIHGGLAWGATSDDGSEIIDQPVRAPDLMGTICTALEIDPGTMNLSHAGRPVPLVDHDAQPIEALLRTSG